MSHDESAQFGNDSAKDSPRPQLMATLVVVSVSPCQCHFQNGPTANLSCKEKKCSEPNKPLFLPPRMLPTQDQPTLAPHPYAHAWWKRPSVCECVSTLQARYDGYLNPHYHTHICKPPTKPTPEQTSVALNKYHVAYKHYDNEYWDEVLTNTYKCMVCPLD